MWILVGALLLLLTLPARAGASDPANGEISRESPVVWWTGQASGAPVIWGNLLLGSAGLPILCEPPFCDEFALRVAHGADLRIESNSCVNVVTQVEVEQPDGSRIFADGMAGSPRTIVDIDSAPPGAYVVRTLVNSTPGAEAGYLGRATLATAPPPARLTVRGRRVAVARATSGKRVRIALATSAPITAIEGTLRAGRSVVGSGKRASLAGRGSLVLTLVRSLKPGAYPLAVTAQDGGEPVTSKATVRVSRRGQRARASRAPASPAGGPGTGASARRC